jgi:hypothetical protein
MLWLWLWMQLRDRYCNKSSYCHCGFKAMEQKPNLCFKSTLLIKQGSEVIQQQLPTPRFLHWNTNTKSTFILSISFQQHFCFSPSQEYTLSTIYFFWVNISPKGNKTPTFSEDSRKLLLYYIWMKVDLPGGARCKLMRRMEGKV